MKSLFTVKGTLDQSKTPSDTGSSLGCQFRTFAHFHDLEGDFLKYYCSLILHASFSQEGTHSSIDDAFDFDFK